MLNTLQWAKTIWGFTGRRLCVADYLSSYSKLLHRHTSLSSLWCYRVTLPDNRLSIHFKLHINTESSQPPSHVKALKCHIEMYTCRHFTTLACPQILTSNELKDIKIASDMYEWSLAWYPNKGSDVWKVMKIYFNCCLLSQCLPTSFPHDFLIQMLYKDIFPTKFNVTKWYCKVFFSFIICILAC